MSPRRWLDGIKHRVKEHWLKMYAKDELVLRVEAAKVGRCFRRLHAHGLLAKIPRTRRWRVTNLLALLPLPDNPIECEWFVLHMASRQLRQVALAFEALLAEHGQVRLQRRHGAGRRCAPRRIGPQGRAARG